MFIKTKLGIGALLLGAFILGGFFLNAYQAGAFGNGAGNGHGFGFWRGGFHKAEGEDLDARKEAWKAEMEEFKASIGENTGGSLHGFRFGHSFGFKGLKGFTDEVDYEVVNLDDGVQITITSDNPDIVQKLQDIAARHSNAIE